MFEITQISVLLAVSSYALIKFNEMSFVHFIEVTALMSELKRITLLIRVSLSCAEFSSNFHSTSCLFGFVGFLYQRNQKTRYKNHCRKVRCFCDVARVSLLIIHRKTEEEDQFRTLSINYCKNEIVMISWYIFSALALALILLTSVFFVTTNQYDLPFDFCIVFLTSVEGNSFIWLLNYVFQVFADVFGSIVFLTNFPLNLLLMNHCCWGVDVLILMLEQLDELTLESEPDHRVIAKRLKGIVKRSYDVIEYQNDVQNLLRFSFFLEFTLLSYLLCMCLFKVVSDPFESLLVYFVIMATLSQLFIYCWMGNMFIVHVEKLITVVYDVKWYAMTVKERKDVLLILTMCQNIKEFNGIFNSVSMETFQKV